MFKKVTPIIYYHDNVIFLRSPQYQQYTQYNQGSGSSSRGGGGSGDGGGGLSGGASAPISKSSLASSEAAGGRPLRSESPANGDANDIGRPAAPAGGGYQQQTVSSQPPARSATADTAGQTKSATGVRKHQEKSILLSDDEDDMIK